MIIMLILMILSICLVIFDDYYSPVLTSLLFDGGYQSYHFRGDKLCNMSVKSYLDKILPYLKMLIDENKVHEQKIQLDIGYVTYIKEELHTFHDLIM